MLVSYFGKTKKGKEVKIYTLTNTNGMEVEIMNLGATIRAIRIPDEKNNKIDVVLGYDDVEHYESGSCYFGATVGRFAGQIAKAQFTMDGETYHLYDNDHGNCMHGGLDAFHRQVFDIKEIDESSIQCSYFSPDMEEGFPGNLDFNVTYSLTDNNELMIHYDATTDKNTLLNITNHSYFNLDESDSVLNHYLMMNCDAYTEDDPDGMPSGNILCVEGTPMDFRTPKTVGSEINDPYYQLHLPFCSGYDHCWVLGNHGNMDEAVICLENPSHNRRMEVFTDNPGVQLYSGNYLGSFDETGKKGKPFHYRQALCLETQMIPNAYSNNHFPDVVLKKGQHYCHTTIYKFSWNY